MEALRLVALFTVVATVYSKALIERASTECKCSWSNPWTAYVSSNEGVRYGSSCTQQNSPNGKYWCFVDGNGCKDAVYDGGVTSLGFAYTSNWKYSYEACGRCTAEDLKSHRGEKFTISAISGITNEQYEYELILGKSINQRDTKHGKNYFLGNYESVDDDGTEFYGNGAWTDCPNWVARESTITYVHGEEPGLIEASETSACKYEFVFQINCKAAIHCKWDEWVIGECSDSCGTGTRTNTRTKLVVEANGGTCSGQPSEIEECNTQPCPIDCEWDEWQVGECDKSCGGGLFTKTREPKVDKAHGGKECTGHSSVTESCNVQECPVHCEWDDWVIGECSDSCGGGTRTNTRTKLVVEANGGTCTGQFSEIEECNNQPCPIHCEWDEWVIGECSDACGTGTRTNTRTKLVVEANGGTCTGQSSEIEECNTQPCPIDCEWDEWQVGECDKSCGGGLLTKTRVPKVDEAHGGKECTGHSSVTESCNCQECPVHCEWDAWVVGECSKTCGGGTQIDTRGKLQEELFGGDPCEGEARREGECNTDECPECYVHSDCDILQKCAEGHCVERCTAEELKRHHGEQFTISDISGVTGVNYEYELVLGKSINQRDTQNDAKYFLGNYESVDDDGTEFYVNGDGCPGGVKRKSTITFVQGEQSGLIEASEPSTCNYEFVFQINCKAD